jgi:hypothetical protein
MFLTVLLLLRSSPLPILPEVSGEMNDDDDDTDSDEAAENKDGTTTATEGTSCFLLQCCITCSILSCGRWPLVPTLVASAIGSSWWYYMLSPTGLLSMIVIARLAC